MLVLDTNSSTVEYGLGRVTSLQVYKLGELNRQDEGLKAVLTG